MVSTMLIMLMSRCHRSFQASPRPQCSRLDMGLDDDIL